MIARLARRAVLGALATAALLAALGARPALAAPAPLDVRLSEHAGRVVATIDVSAAFQPAMEHDLGNGLTNVIAVYVAVTPLGARSPALFYGRVVEILYDVWEETYAVTVKDPHVPQGLHLVLKDFAALRAFLSKERDLDVGPASLLPAGAFVVDARVEVNPVSKEQLQRTREFIANPSTGTRSSAGSRSVLGAMASFLLREPDAGSDVFLFRSRPIAPAEVTRR